MMKYSIKNCDELTSDRLIKEINKGIATLKKETRALNYTMKIVAGAWMYRKLTDMSYFMFNSTEFKDDIRLVCGVPVEKSILMDNDILEIQLYEDKFSYYESLFPTKLTVYPDKDNKFRIKKVIFNNPATIVYWEDGTKTIVKCGEYDTFDEEKGLAMAISKKALGNKGNFYEVFKKYINEKEM